MTDKFPAAMQVSVKNNIKAEIDGFIYRLLLENPDTTANQVLDAIRKAVGGGRATTAAKAAPKAKKQKSAPKKVQKKAAAPPKAKKGFSPRTKEGRQELDAAIVAEMKSLGSKNIAAEALRKALGGTPHQIRTSLNRHIEQGAITYKGQKRATRYSLK